MADIPQLLRQWSATASNNQPTGATPISTGLDDNLRVQQATIRQFLASPGSTIASASTVDLSTADGKTIPISGNVTVTGLGTESAGIPYLLQILGTQVWKNSSAMPMPASVDQTFVAGDYIQAESKGAGNWFFPFMTKASGQPFIPLTTQISQLNATVASSALDTFALFSSATSVANKITISSLIASNVASQTDMESAVSNSVLATPLNMNWHPGMAKAWVNFNGNTALPTIRASYNVSSVTKSATGTYNINLITQFSSGNYVISGHAVSPGTANGTVQQNTVSPNASVVPITAVNLSNAAFDAQFVSVVVYGDQ